VRAAPTAAAHFHGGTSRAIGQRVMRRRRLRNSQYPITDTEESHLWSFHAFGAGIARSAVHSPMVALPNAVEGPIRHAFPARKVGLAVGPFPNGARRR